MKQQGYGPVPAEQRAQDALTKNFVSGFLPNHPVRAESIFLSTFFLDGFF